MFNPFTYSEQKIDPVAEEIIRLGVNVPNVSQYYNGAVDLTLFKNKSGINAYDRLNTILSKTTYNGKTLDQALQSLIQQDFYKIIYLTQSLLMKILKTMVVSTEK